MQIRKQLRNAAVLLAKHPEEFLKCCYNRTCPSGYHGHHVRVRFKARSRNHGTAVGQSKKGHQ